MEKKYGYGIDWKVPMDVNVKNQWLICFVDTSRWPELADKFKISKYVREKGYGHLLPKLYGTWSGTRKKRL